MQAVIVRKSSIVPTARVRQMRGLFDVAPASSSEQSWSVNLDLPPEWNVGVIVGPSGCGKSTVARELFGQSLVSDWPWPADKSILDGFPAAMGIKDITALLSSVGFSSPPAWLRPFAVLSNGQQFRVNLARTLAELPDLAVVDEFTSVVDRTVAQIGSAAVAKTVRRRKQKFIAVTCHYDVIDWLEPDWIYEPETNAFQAAKAARGLLRRRPAIHLEIVRVDRSAWRLFQGHHYLSGDLHKASKCFVALIAGRPAAFAAVISFPHAVRPGWREHRLVCLPDFQGAGIGNRLSEYIAGIFAASKPYRSTTSHPSMVRHRHASPLWKMTREPSLAKHMSEASTEQHLARSISTSRLTASFEYVGPTRKDEAGELGLSLAA